MRVLLTIAIGLVLSSSVTAQARPEGDEWLKRPVDDRTFRTYLSFFAYDHQQPLDLKVSATQDVDGIKVEALNFQSGPGARVTARFHQGPATARGGPGIVLIHGGGPAGKDSPGIRKFADFLARAGYTTVAFDLQYFGERKTDLLTTFSE